MALLYVVLFLFGPVHWYEAGVKECIHLQLSE